MRFRIVTALALCLALACARTPESPAGPRPLGTNSTIYGDAGELHILYTYQAYDDRQVDVHVQIEAKGDASVGEVTFKVALDGFDLVRGEPKWTIEVPPGGSDTHTVRIAPRENGEALVTISHARASMNEPLARVTTRFRVTDDEVRPARPDDPPVSP